MSSACSRGAAVRSSTATNTAAAKPATVSASLPGPDSCELVTRCLPPRSPELLNHERHQRVDRRRLQLAVIGEGRRQRSALRRGQLLRDAALELRAQHGDALVTALAMPDGIMHLAPLGRAAVLEVHLHGVADVALLRVVVVARVLR